MYPTLQSYFMFRDKPPVVLKLFETFVNELYLKHLRSLVVLFNKQVQNIEWSKALIIELKSCFDSEKLTIEERVPLVNHYQIFILKFISSSGRIKGK